MASLKFAVFLFICFHGSALTSAEGLQMFPDDLSLGDTCQDCTQIFKLLADLLSSSNFQKKMIDGLENLCDHLPGPKTAVKLCKEEVDKTLPIVISFLTSVMKPEQVCSVLGLCGSSDEEKLLVSSVREALKAALALEKVQPATQCTFCIFLFQTLETLLPKEKIESLVTWLMEHICVIFPSSYQKECEALIDKYGGSYSRESPTGPLHFEILHVQRF
ncbi:hypothetical protein LDENG_00145270 [Lucifuga dentata]|nr:hypothetical protein LDENG_00145270 [Lucifuga dentata]